MGRPPDFALVANVGKRILYFGVWINDSTVGVMLSEKKRKKLVPIAVEYVELDDRMRRCRSAQQVNI
jgi:hypothetical protein